MVWVAGLNLPRSWGPLWDSLEAAHGMVKEIARPLGLPGNQDHGPEGTKHEHWEENTRRTLARFNQATYRRQDFKDLHQVNNKPQLPLDETLITVFNAQ